MTVDFNWAEWKPKITGIEQEIDKKKKRFDWLQPLKDWGRYFFPEVSERLKGTIPDPEVDVPGWLPLPPGQTGRQPLSRVTENIALIPMVGELPPAGNLGKQIPKVAKEAEEFAGNIRLSKFPDWIKGEIKTFAEKNPDVIQTARRGVIPDAEVAVQAKQLAEEVGSNLPKLIKKWKPGEAWNAEEILAIRGSLRSKITEIQDIRTRIMAGANSDENLLRLQKSIIDHAQLQEVVSGVTAEAGRSLRQFRQQAIEVLKDPNADKLDAILKVLGGRGKVEDIARKLGQLDLNNPNQINAFIRSVVKPKLNDYLVELYYNAILSGPKTHIINTASNTFNAILSPFEKLGSALMEVPAALVQRRPRERFFGEVAQETFGLIRGIPEGVKSALQVLKTGGTVEQASKYELPRLRAFTGLKGKIINAPSVALETADALFYGINKTVALRAQAYREAAKSGLKGQSLANKLNELIENPSKEILKNAHDISEYRLFRQPAGKFTSRVMQLRDAEIFNIKPLRFVIPFLRTPVNLLKYGLERSPIAILNPKMWQNFLNKSPEFSDQFARWAIGSSVASAIALYVADDKITGAPPKTPSERDRFYREGKLPYAIKVGDKWVSYQRLEPFNQVLTQVAAVVESIKMGEKDEAKISDMVGNATTMVGKNFVSQSYMAGIADIINAMEDPERYGGQWVQRTLASMATPASGLTRTVEQIQSPIIEDPDNIIEAIEANVPFLSSRVPPKMTAFGEPAKRQGSAWFPIQISPEQKTPLNNELSRLEVNLGFVGDTVWGIELSRDEKKQYQNIAGQLVKKAIQAEMKTPPYLARTTSDGWRKQALEKAASKAQTQATTQMLDRLYREGKIKGDKKLVYEYQAVLRKIPPDFQSKFGSNIREARPDIDAALNMEGVVSTVKSQAALTILIERAQRRGIPIESLPAFQNLLKKIEE